MNYTHLFPMFCVSIAFCLNGVPVVGVIYQPVLDTTYSALVGNGAWQDDRHAIKKRKSLPYVQNPKAVLPVSFLVLSFHFASRVLRFQHEFYWASCHVNDLSRS